jgi:tRNA 2-thiouridine synthesizing protein A
MPNEGTASGPIASDLVHVNALGMQCPWPVLRAARAMRTANAIMIAADDPIAASELAALASEHGWTFHAAAPHRFTISRIPATLV